jgi:hypothetical protein
MRIMTTVFDAPVEVFGNPPRIITQRREFVYNLRDENGVWTTYRLPMKVEVDVSSLVGQPQGMTVGGSLLGMLYSWESWEVNDSVLWRRAEAERARLNPPPTLKERLVLWLRKGVKR